MKEWKTQIQIGPLTDPHKSNLSSVLGLNIRFSDYRSKQAGLPLSKCSLGPRNSMQTTSDQSGQAVNGALERRRTIQTVNRVVSVISPMPYAYVDKTAGGGWTSSCATKKYIKRYVSGIGWRTQIVDMELIGERRIRIEAIAQLGCRECDIVIGAVHNQVEVTLVESKSCCAVLPLSKNLDIGHLRHPQSTKLVCPARENHDL